MSHGFRTALASLQAESRPAAPAYVVDGRYNRFVIMHEAVKVARSLRAGGKSWSWRMKMGLTAAWRWARAAIAAPAPAPAPVALDRPVYPALVAAVAQPSPRARTTVFHRGSRAVTHGW